MKISVLINNHNYGEYLEKAIESVMSQTYRDFELIIVDGASTDNSRKIINKYIEKYPKIITAVEKPTSGQADAMNIGFLLSKGDIISFLDSDDYFYPNKLEEIVNLHKKYNLIATSYRYKDSKKKCLREFKFRKDNFETREKLLKEYGYITTYAITTSCISLTREFAKRIFPLPTKFITYADFYIKVLGTYFGEFRIVDKPLTFYRIHLKQESVKRNFTRYDLIEHIIKPTYVEVNKKLNKEKLHLIPNISLENTFKGFIKANKNVGFEKKNYVLYGIGSFGEFVYSLTSPFGINFPYVIDSFKENWGKKWHGIKIISPEEAKLFREQYDKIIITSSFENEVISNLKNNGLEENTDFVKLISVPFD